MNLEVSRELWGSFGEVFGTIQTDEKRNIKVQTDKQTDRLWILMGGWVDGWMETKVGLRDCLAQSKKWMDGWMATNKT